MVPILIGLVCEDNSGKFWSRGAVWEIDGEYQFHCSDCSIKTLKKIRFDDITQEQDERVREELAKMGDVAGPLNQIPDKFTGSLYIARDEGDWKFRLRPNGILKCESCGKLVI